MGQGKVYWCPDLFFKAEMLQPHLELVDNVCRPLWLGR